MCQVQTLGWKYRWRDWPRGVKWYYVHGTDYITLWLEQNGWHFTDRISKWILLNENFCVKIHILLQFVHESSIKHVTLVASTRTIVLVPYHQVKLLQITCSKFGFLYIWPMDASSSNELRRPDFMTEHQDSSSVIPAGHTPVTESMAFCKTAVNPGH